MPSAPTSSPSPETQELLNEFEFRLNSDLVTRPTLEARRRGTLPWTILAYVIPDSNYYSILVQVLCDTATAQTDFTQEEER